MLHRQCCGWSGKLTLRSVRWKKQSRKCQRRCCQRMRYIETFVVDLETQCCAMQDDKKLVFSKRRTMHKVLRLIGKVDVAQRKMKQINNWFQCPVRNLNTKRRMRCFPKDVLLNKNAPLILKLAVAQHKKKKQLVSKPGSKLWTQSGRGVVAQRMG